MTVMENLRWAPIPKTPAEWDDNLDRISACFILAESRGQAADPLRREQKMLEIGRGIASSPRLLMLTSRRWALPRW